MLMPSFEVCVDKLVELCGINLMMESQGKIHSEQWRNIPFISLQSFSQHVIALVSSMFLTLLRVNYAPTEQMGANRD